MIIRQDESARFDYFMSIKMHFKCKDPDKLKGNAIPILSYAKSEHIKASLPTLISDKLGIKIRNIIRDKEGYFTTIKGLIQQKNLTVLNMYVTY